MTERNNYWRGEHILLRIPTMADVDAIVADFERIDYDSEAECLADELHLPRSPQGCRLHWEQIAKGGPPSDNCSLVIIDHSENLCGFIGVHDTSPRHGGFCYGMSILPEFRGLGYAKEAVTMVLDYYFNHLRYHRCGTHIYDFNPRSIRFHEKMGFVKCGQLHGCHFFEGKYHDSFLYEMISEHFNTINDR